MKVNKFTTWVKTHKSELIITGSIVATIGTVFLIDNWESVIGSTFVCQKTRSTRTIEVVSENPVIPVMTGAPAIKTINVKEHLRNLPHGRHPSMQKVKEAMNSGIELLENQTIISAHSRCYAAA